jgi:hypothetical protein
MTPGSSLLSKLRPGAVRWAVVYEAAKLIYTHGRRVWDEYSPEERARLGTLVRKSKGRRVNLTSAEQEELWALVKKAAPWS